MMRLLRPARFIKGVLCLLLLLAAANLVRAEKFDVEAVRLKAQAGDARNQTLLGWLYVNGQGVMQNFPEAFQWFAKASRQGFASAQFNLALMYENGQGVAKNAREAVRWYRNAAEKGHVSAQNNLGLMFYRGLGTVKNFQEAMKWFRAAADKGDSSAENNLGVMYYNGHGSKVDMVEAYHWFTLATGQGEPGASKSLEKVTPKLSADQLAQGKLLVLESRKQLQAQLQQSAAPAPQRPPSPAQTVDKK